MASLQYLFNGVHHDISNNDDLALLSKPTAVALPGLLLLLDYWPLRRAEPWRKLVLEKIVCKICSEKFILINVYFSMFLEKSVL